MSGFGYDLSNHFLTFGNKVAPVNQQLEHSNFSSQDALSGHCRGLLEVPTGYVCTDDMRYTVSARDCMSTGYNDVNDLDATCSSRDVNTHSKQLSIADPSASNAPQLTAWPQASYSQDVEVLDQDIPSTCQPSTQVHWEQRCVQAPAEQAHVSRDQQRLLKRFSELQDMLEKISAACESEQRLAPESNYLDFAQPSTDNVTAQMRMIVCSWLSEVATEFNCQQETLFLAVQLLDRFMSNSKGVPRSALQLVAVACMLVAAKHEEVTHPNIEDFTDIAANCFQVEDLRRMERLLIDHLSWRIKCPTSYTFLHLYTQATAMVRDVAAQQYIAQQDPQTVYEAAVSGNDHGMPKSMEPMSGQLVAKAAYLTELSMLDYKSLAFKPSQIAASALLLAQSWSEQGAAPHELQQISGYSCADLYECMGRLLQLHQCAADCDSSEMLAPFKHIQEKYAQDCWLHTSQCAVPSTALQALAPAAADAAGALHAPVQEEQYKHAGDMAPRTGCWI